jgi:lipopolysaccharide/colanic/teichoic acid biosynthesis glycosyltransferase
MSGSEESRVSAGIMGRSDIPFGEMVQLDYLYVTSWSLGGDVKLIAKTIPQMLFSRSTT